MAREEAATARSQCHSRSQKVVGILFEMGVVPSREMVKLGDS